MNEIELFDAMGGGIRSGVSADGRSYVVSADLAKALGVTDSSKFAAGVDATNVGTEIIRGSTGLRKVNVLYKRGVFHVLMLSRKPKAAEFKDKLFDFLEQIERGGGVLLESRSAAQNARLGEMIKYREARDLIALADDYAPSSPEAIALFTRIQDRLLLCVTGQHAPELRSSREIVTWTGKRGPTKADLATAKNYLSKTELTQLSGISDIVVGTIKVEYPEAGYTIAEFEQRVFAVMRGYSLTT